MTEPTYSQAQFALLMAVERAKDVGGGADVKVIAKSYYDWLVTTEGRR